VNPGLPGGPRGAEHDDPESADAAPAAVGAERAADRLDLAPATARHAGRGRRNRSRTLVGIAVLVVVIGGLGAVLFNGLNDAATFFYNVDEAVERRDELAGERFRMQGNVVAGSVEPTAEGVSFVLRYGGEEVGVDHVGDPPELFGPEIPVVLEGSFDGDRFASDAILIRHDNTYDEENPDRIREAERDAQAGGTTPGGDAG
jgi:cytochrome c-type biogenesis protein CcmE